MLKTGTRICNKCEVTFIIEQVKCGKLSTRKYCDKCTASIIEQKKTKIKNCKFCSKQFILQRQTNGKFSKIRYCELCFSTFKFLNIIENQTKGDFFKARKNWQSARSSIRRHADKIFKKSNRERNCVICGYSNHVEIAHIKSVSSFDDQALLKEINDINNLVPLCPNHHWEIDNGLLTIDLFAGIS